MSQVCELTGKRPSYGNKVSHSNIKTRTRWMPNLRSKRFEIPELKRTVSLLLSTRAFRTIDKFGGITPAIMNAKDENLSTRLLKVKRYLHKTRVNATAGGQKAPVIAPAPHHEEAVKHAAAHHPVAHHPAKKTARAAKKTRTTKKARKAPTAKKRVKTKKK